MHCSAIWAKGRATLVCSRRAPGEWPGVRRAGLQRQSPALTPGQRRAQRAALIFTTCAIPATSSPPMRARILGNSWHGWATTVRAPR